jgi:hypothetical protein
MRHGPLARRTKVGLILTCSCAVNRSSVSKADSLLGLCSLRQDRCKAA